MVNRDGFKKGVMNLCWLSVAGLLLAASCAFPAKAQPQKVRMTIPANAMLFMNLFVAQDNGYFKDNDLDMEVVVTQGDGPDVDALIAGSVQFTISTSNRLLTAYQQGKPLLAVMGTLNRVAMNCFIRKDVAERVGINANTPLNEKFTKLKGLTYAGTRPGAYTYLMMVDYLRRVGLQINKDMRFVGVGNGQAMIASVENGQTDLGCFPSPIPENAVHRGKSVWYLNNTKGEDDRYKDILFQLLYVRPEYAKTNPETVRKVVATLMRANAWILQASDGQLLPIAKKRFSGFDDQVLLEGLANLKLAINASGKISKESVEAATDFLRQSEMFNGSVPWEAVADNSFLPK